MIVGGVELGEEVCAMEGAKVVGKIVGATVDGAMVGFNEVGEELCIIVGAKLDGKVVGLGLGRTDGEAVGNEETENVGAVKEGVKVNEVTEVGAEVVTVVGVCVGKIDCDGAKEGAAELGEKDGEKVVGIVGASVGGKVGSDVSGSEGGGGGSGDGFGLGLSFGLSLDLSGGFGLSFGSWREILGVL